MKEYQWRQISQWDIPDNNIVLEIKEVNTGLSKASCRFILTHCIDTGGGYIRYEPITKDIVTIEMLEIAGTP